MYSLLLEYVVPLNVVQSQVDAVALPLGIPVSDSYVFGMRMAVVTTLLMIALELLSLPTAIALMKSDPSLYAWGWIISLRNNMLVGPFVAYVAAAFFCVPGPLDPTSRVIRAVAVGLVHAIGYYAAHRAMHTKALYWAHRFHHKFNIHVTPTAANAVSWAEYGIAYMLPFVVGTLVCRPDWVALEDAVTVVSFNNLLIHTPILEAAAGLVLPTWLVGTDKHIEHHRKLTTNYAAPTINVDAILATSASLSAFADRLFLAVGGRPVAVRRSK